MMTLSKKALLAAQLLCASGVALGEEFRASDAEIKAWVSADLDENGVLTPEEFSRFVRAMAAVGQSTAQLVVFFDAYETAFGVADANGDGIVSPQELRSADDDYRENAER